MTEDARERTFDELASALASGTISRRRALKLAGAAMLGSSTGLLTLFPHRRAQAQEFITCPEDEPAISNRRCVINRCGPASCEASACFCVTTVEGDKRCIDGGSIEECPTSDECDSNRDCPGEQLCLKVGGCCGHRRRNLCGQPCRRECPP
jgi:hypothetical protein